MYKYLLILILPALLSIGCQTNPVTGKRELMLISKSQEEQIDAEYAPEIAKQLGGKIDSPELQKYVSSVGQKVASASYTPNRNFTFAALNDKMVNAFALPGGSIFITRGLLEILESEAQLAAILAHEVSHVSTRDVSNAMSNQIGMNLVLSAAIPEDSPRAAVTAANVGAKIISLGFSRSDEKQADSGGLHYLVRAGYPPQAMAEVMQKLNEQSGQRSIEFLSTHPNPENRIELINEQIYRRAYPKDRDPKKEAYRKNVLNNLPETE